MMERTSQRLMEGTSQWGKGRGVNDFWLPLKKYGELSRVEKCSLCSIYMQLLFFFQNLQKRSLVCMNVWLSPNMLPTYDPRSGFIVHCTWETRTHHREGPQWNVAHIMLQLKITLITSVLKVLTRAITSVTNISL